MYQTYKAVDHDFRVLKKCCLKKYLKRLKFYPFKIDISNNFSKVGLIDDKNERIAFNNNINIDENLNNLLFLNVN